MRTILMIMVMALGLAAGTSATRIDPIPHCFPCPDVR